MIFEEIEKYKVNCIISKDELYMAGISIDDIIERTSNGWNYLKELRASAIKYTSYEWPGCAYSMQIKIIDDDMYSLTFSETIDDFIFGLKQSLSITGSEALESFINTIEYSDEAEARKLIKSFETNVRIANQ